MDTKYYFISGFILLIFLMYFYFKKPEIKNVHNIELEDVKKLLSKQEDSNKLVKELIFQLSKYIKSNSNKKLRLDVLNKSDLFKKDYRTSRILLSKSYEPTDLETDYIIEYVLKQTFKNVIGFKYISSILNLQLWHPEVEAGNRITYTNNNITESVDSHPDKYYFDLIVENIPYVACKKSDTLNHIIERIPIEYKSKRKNTDINFHAPIIQKDIYFYPINLNKLNIKLTDIDGSSLKDIWTIKDISIEFEITYIINETNCGLSTAK